MKAIFPETIQSLPEADIPIDGITAFLSQADKHQIIFMQFAKDVHLPEHTHNAHVGFVLAGRIELIINGKPYSYGKGDVYHIPYPIQEKYVQAMPILLFLMNRTDMPSNNMVFSTLQPGGTWNLNPII